MGEGDIAIQVVVDVHHRLWRASSYSQREGADGRLGHDGRLLPQVEADTAIQHCLANMGQALPEALGKTSSVGRQPR